MNNIICPTVLAENEADFAAQMRIVAPLANRLQIDLMDGAFASPKSIDIKDVWWPHHVQADLHLMYQQPFEYLDTIIHKQPRMVVVHVEAMFHHMHFAAELHKHGIKAGLAILPDTPVQNIEQILNSFDHLLIFSGHLGHFGGQADLALLDKVAQAKAHHPDLEFGWDGGANKDNVQKLAHAGINVINVGGAIHKSEDPKKAYKELADCLA